MMTFLYVKQEPIDQQQEEWSRVIVKIDKLVIIVMLDLSYQINIVEFLAIIDLLEQDIQLNSHENKELIIL